MLPDGGNSPWPPAPHSQVFNKYAEWSAWYSGDPDALAAAYTNAPPPATGWIRRLARWWWGMRPTPGQPVTKLHVPAAADLATLSADLLLSQPPRLTAEDDATTARLAKHMDEAAHATLREAAEIAAALGGVWLRVTWDTSLADRPWLSTVHPDAAVGEWRHGHLVGVTFFRVLADDGASVVRHLEEHVPGRISHGLYVGGARTLGVRVPLTEHPATQPFVPHLTSGDGIDTGIRPITAAYVPNIRPARLWRHNPAAAMLGRPDIEGLEPLLDQLDERWSDWMREVRLAKARLLVPHSFLDSAGPGKGATFDAEAELLTAMNMGPAPDASALQLVQPEIRVAALSSTVEALLAQIIRSAGYSAQSFGGAEGGDPLTATEVNSRDTRSSLTRRKKLSYWAPGVAAIAEPLLAIDQAVFKANVVPQRPKVVFPPVVDPDALTVAQSLNMLRAAKAASTRTLVATLHPDWDERQIADETALIDQPVSPAPPGAEAIPNEPQEGN